MVRIVQYSGDEVEGFSLRRETNWLMMHSTGKIERSADALRICQSPIIFPQNESNNKSLKRFLDKKVRTGLVDWLFIRKEQSEPVLFWPGEFTL